MSAARTADGKGRFGRLLDQWKAPDDSGRPVGCLATSFTFDPVFFEEECIARFLRMDTDPNEDGVAYLIEREEKLAEAKVVALVDYRHADPMRSLRWDLLPVRVAGAAQHAKISLLAWERVVRLVVASANLTESGYRSNLEVFSALDFRNGGSAPLEVLSPILGFLRGMLADYVEGNSGELGPKRSAVQLLRRIEALAGKMEPGRRSKIRVRPLLGGLWKGQRHQVMSWLIEQAQSRGRPESATVVSPFFDDDDRSALDSLQEVLLQQGDRWIDLAGQGVSVEDGRVRLFIPAWTAKNHPKRLQIGFHRVVSEDGEEDRRLHAKIMFLQREGSYEIAVVGSSNFTRAGLGLGDGPINLEANLVYLAPVKDSGCSDLKGLLPRMEGPLAADQVIFDPPKSIDTGEGEGAFLPGSFREALFRPLPDRGEIVLRFGLDLPTAWSIHDQERHRILSSSEWEALGSPLELRQKWVSPRPPSFLEVRWHSPEAVLEKEAHQPFSARWAVNVTEPALLPPPEELRTLPLETLLEILTSARPLHETLVRILQRKAKRKSGAPDLDPLKRFRDETQLLYRTRKVARALEQLRLRLERPVLHEDALQWRLEGPVGPLALARALAKEARSPAEGAFLAAEVAMTVAAVRIPPSRTGVPPAKVRRRLAACVRRLKEEIQPQSLAAAHPQMREYIEDALRKATS